MVWKKMVKGMSLVPNQKDEPLDSPCEPCLHGKQTCKPIPTETHNRKQTILVRIFSDVCGKMQMPSWTRNNYFMTFIDDTSRILDIAFLKQKSEVLRHFKAFVERVERETEFKVKIL
jgi:Uma2 family endonuclease